MSVDAATVKRIGRLARIRIEEGEVAKYQDELNAILGFVAQLDEVDVAGDLKTAKVYIGILGTAEQKKLALEMMGKVAPRIQALVARTVILKYTPKLKFLVDESVDRGNRVLSIIEELEKTLPKD